VAVEADPAALVQLRANIAANPDLAPRITVVDRAVAPQPGLVRMGARRKLGDSMSSTLLGGADRTWQIAAITPAELARLIGPSERLVVKIDIEGGEYALLPTLGPLIARPGTAVLLSLHPQILRESGAGDLIERTRAALAPFAGWNAFALDGVDVVPASPEHAAFAPCRDWLFVKACRHSELGPGAPKF
jgi:FkbM family methyltransferase